MTIHNLFRTPIRVDSIFKHLIPRLGDIKVCRMVHLVHELSGVRP